MAQEEIQLIDRITADLELTGEERFYFIKAVALNSCEDQDQEMSDEYGKTLDEINKKGLTKSNDALERYFKALIALYEQK